MLFSICEFEYVETIMEKLTERERIILNLLTQGYDNNQIAKKIFISRHTVKAHMSSIIKKLNAKNRTNAVYIAAINKLVRFNKIDFE